MYYVILISIFFLCHIPWRKDLPAAGCIAACMHRAAVCISGSSSSSLVNVILCKAQFFLFVGLKILIFLQVTVLQYVLVSMFVSVTEDATSCVCRTFQPILRLFSFFFISRSCSFFPLLLFFLCPVFVCFLSKVPTWYFDAINYKGIFFSFGSIKLLPF